MKFNFIPSRRVYAEVKETLSSYFAAGAITDLLFDTWTSSELRKLGITVQDKAVAVVELNNYKGTLPQDFDRVHDVWLCNGYSHTKTITDPSFVYYQEDYAFEDQCEDKCDKCREGDYNNCSCPETYKDCKVVHRVTGKSVLSFSRNKRLTPGDEFTRDICQDGCPVNKVRSEDTFQINGCNIFSTVKEGVVNIFYYKKNIDKDGNILIPDHPYVKEYLVKHLIFKCYEKLLNDSHDETFNQVRVKKLDSEKARKDAYLNMSFQLKKPTKEGIIKSAQRERSKFNRLKRRYY